jgi:hypothetical protein
MSYNKSVAYFKRLENLEKIRRINGPAPLPVDNKKPVVSSTVGVAVGKKWLDFASKIKIKNKENQHVLIAIIVNPWKI